MSEVILEVSNLKKHFPTPKGVVHAVDGVDFKIYKGKTLGVVGESGCGKSTTGRLVLRLLEPTEGSVVFEGKDIAHLNKKELNKIREDIQIIFQDPYASLNPRMSVGEIIAEPLIIHNVFGKDKEKLQAKVKELMKLVGLADRLYGSFPHELDGGRRQRIGIARALALNPKFIVCDEPVSALDVSIQAQILNLMKDLQDKLGLTYMFITHDLSVVKHFSDDILVMYLGLEVEKAPAGELFKKNYHPYTKALLSAIPVPNIDVKQKRIELTGEITSPIDPAPGCRFAARCPYAKDVCFKENPVFEEISKDHFVACHFTKEINDI
ncbi:MAG: ABC transporter ATP-binding protein [Bacilli bacterium]